MTDFMHACRNVRPCHSCKSQQNVLRCGLSSKANENLALRRFTGTVYLTSFSFKTIKA